MRTRIRAALTGLVMAGLAIAAGASPAAAGAPVYPDLAIKAEGGAFSGEDVRGGAVGQQAIVEGLHDEQQADFKVRVGNDGSNPGTLTISGSPSTASFKVRYFKGQQNITQAVKQGTYQLGVGAGAHKTIRLEVTAKTGSAAGTGIIVEASNPAAPTDVVLAEVSTCACEAGV
jgi:hypothetical protein